MNGVTIGVGELDGKGIYADKDFKKGEAVIQYRLTPLTKNEIEKLPEKEKLFVHSHWGTPYLYAEPERYVNHSDTPNTHQDLERQCDTAIRDIAKGEMITTDARKDDII